MQAKTKNPDQGKVAKEPTIAVRSELLPHIPHLKMTGRQSPCQPGGEPAPAISVPVTPATQQQGLGAHSKQHTPSDSLASEAALVLGRNKRPFLARIYTIQSGF